LSAQFRLVDAVLGVRSQAYRLWPPWPPCCGVCLRGCWVTDFAAGRYWFGPLQDAGYRGHARLDVVCKMGTGSAWQGAADRGLPWQQ